MARWVRDLALEPKVQGSNPGVAEGRSTSINTHWIGHLDGEFVWAYSGGPIFYGKLEGGTATQVRGPYPMRSPHMGKTAHRLKRSKTGLNHYMQITQLL